MPQIHKGKLAAELAVGDALLDLTRRLLRDRRPMTPAELREQAISFAYGQMASMSRYRDAGPAELEEMRAICARAYDKLHPHNR